MPNLLVGFPTAGVLVGTGYSTVYTCPSATKARVLRLAMVNVTGGAVALSVHIVRTGDVVGNKNLITKALSVAAGATAVITEIAGQSLQAGDTIQITSDTASSASVQGSLMEITQA